jgi:hypothetical protein
MTPRRAARTDLNHKPIREGIQADGYYWCDTFRLGDGFVDGICVSKTGIPVFVEIKTNGEEYTKKEKKFVDEFPGPYVKVETLDELRLAMKKWDSVYLAQVPDWY